VVQSRRTVAMPLDRQYRYSTGVQYDVAKDLTLGAAYTLIDAGDAPFNMESGPLKGNLVGRYRPNFIHAIGLNLNKRF
jgi:long-subunit fatty acid transport protein